MRETQSRPALRGGFLALMAAALFGVSTPLVQRFGVGVGMFSTAALLYAGAASIGALLRQPIDREARIRRSDAPRLLWMALCGAVLGPVALAWGLQRTSGVSASLMLSAEAAFTALLARIWLGERLDRRIMAAMTCLTLGGMALLLDRSEKGGVSQAVGLLCVAVATVAWAADNTLSRGVSHRDPAQVVMVKSLAGSAATILLAAVMDEPALHWTSAVALYAVGATGYGLSLHFYLMAQRAFGAARTASVFAFAPFVGALLAFILGERGASPSMCAGAVLMLTGITLHLLERHSHEHSHEAGEHEHSHRHDDGHHTHAHQPMPEGTHSHSHFHEPLRHAHPHAPDALHTHRH